jgi:hypothetical protein
MAYTIAHDGARPMTITDASFEVYTEDEPRGVDRGAVRW